MKKIFSKLHLWLSVPFGLIISVLCITGALLVFETEIQQVTNPERFYVKEVKESPIPLDELIPMVQKQLPDTVTISSVTFPAQPDRNYRMGMTGMGRTSLVVDPYSGEIMDMVTPYAKGNFFSGVRRLHRWFMYPMQRDGVNWGKMLTGTATLIFVFILVSGVVIWIPKTILMLKRRLKVKIGAGTFRFWYDLHLVGGIYALIFLLVMSLTGLTWSFQWYRTGFYKLFGIEVTQGGGHGAPQQGGNTRNSQQQSGGRPTSDKNEGDASAGRNEGGQPPEGERGGRNRSGERAEGSDNENRRGGRGATFTQWEKVYKELAVANPGYKSISVQSGSATVSTATSGNTRASDKYIFHARTGEITESQLYKDTPKSGKIRGWIYSVHVGTWGGLFTRILYFLACLTGGILPLTGYYIYIKKNWKKKRKKA